MENSMLFTIFAGVSVFVLGQFILKLVLEPIVAFKRSVGEISALFLREQHKITNAHCTLEIEYELKRLASSLLSIRQSIPFYKCLSELSCVPKDANLHSACGSLNLISYLVKPNKSNSEPKYDTCSQIIEEMNNIAKNLNVRISYSNL